MQVIGEAGQFTQPEGPFGAHWVEQFRVPDLSVGTYSIPVGGTDDQVPHNEDEIYVVTAGHAMFEAGEKRVPVAPGSVIYVAAGESHKFTDVTVNLAMVVLFAPAEGSRPVPQAVAFVDDYVSQFNEAVAMGDFSGLLALFTDDAVIRFEKVPGSTGVLEFTGRAAYTTAYAEQPPDDQIELAAEPREEDGSVVAAFVWRGDKSPGVMRFAITDGLISRLIVTFG
jgi:quercetin dioxygenase-like cupin family protein